GRGLTEFHIRFVNGDGRLETLFVQRLAGRRKKSSGGEPEAAAVGQPHQFLLGGATDRMFADQIGALVADERRREELRRSGGARVDQEGRGQTHAAVAASRRDRFFLSAA